MPSTKPPKLSPTAQRRAFEQLRNLLENPDTSLGWHYRLGLLVERLIPRDKSQRRARGMAEMLQALGKPRHFESVLFATRKFVAHFRPEDLADLKGLTWGHMAFLVGVKSRREWKRLVQQCRRDNLNCHELGRLVQETRQAQTGSGRRLKDPTPLGPRGALRETIRLSKLWCHKCCYLLEDSRPRLKQDLRGKPDPELVKLLEGATAALMKLHKEVAKQRHELQALAKRRS